MTWSIRDMLWLVVAISVAMGGARCGYDRGYIQCDKDIGPRLTPPKYQIGQRALTDDGRPWQVVTRMIGPMGGYDYQMKIKYDSGSAGYITVSEKELEEYLDKHPSTRKGTP